MCRLQPDPAGVLDTFGKRLQGNSARRRGLWASRLCGAHSWLKRHVHLLQEDNVKRFPFLLSRDSRGDQRPRDSPTRVSAEFIVSLCWYPHW